MKYYISTGLSIFLCVLLVGCASNNHSMWHPHDQPATDQTAQQGQPATAQQTIDVKSPETGHAPSFQNQGGANAARMISPVTQ